MQSLSLPILIKKPPRTGGFKYIDSFLVYQPVHYPPKGVFFHEYDQRLDPQGEVHVIW